ncbi:hypothetical protein ASPZODRAFT_73831 [Penicilliopsis zonata CBS 506.65]|uniref:Uncharacterized protein n=1 Tax=Penicilliopsis zonata CBS 506.65 TaxID=1073090 RepID=A0A1L9S8U1_9EURO|nr:hypothetical protein ASPZODRAFT_73831 [Penicilliopsis zonata CBS 506.65]OJJ43576.1 hypothetical protein ASPZODRAFT_73831 [Penicilliopsis zonata CBS 506.65]
MANYLTWKPDLGNPEKINALQKKRWRFWDDLEPEIKHAASIHRLLQCEFELRECTQREMALKDKLAGYQKKLDTEAGLIQDIKVELLQENKRYWELELQWWVVRSAFQECPFTHGVNFWRSHPRWYMHRVLREDCARRGGCCRRGCGCCSNRQNWPDREFAAGHCTFECHCCENARGFELSQEKKSFYNQIFDLGKDNGYFYRISHSSLMGLILYNDDNPFDLIDDPPPNYETSSRTS